MSGTYELMEDSLRVRDLLVTNPDAIAFFKRVNEDDREATLTKAIEVGLFCLERGQNTQDIEFVKRQIQQLMNNVELALGGVATTAENALVGKIGTENGQVLAPIKSIVDASTETVRDRLREVKDLLTSDLDPKNATGTLGLALSRVSNLLDSKREDSIQWSLSKAVESVTAVDGAITSTVKKTVEDAIKPLKDEVDELSRQLSGEKMVEEALANTPGKGKTFEESVADGLATWARTFGARVERVGEDNQPGDFVVDFQDDTSGTTTLRVVVEARDRQTAHGRQRISQDLSPKIRHRKAQAAIHVSKTTAGFAREIGEWSEGHCDSGPWVACTHEHLTLALRFVVVEHKIRKMREARPEVDTAVIRAQTDAIRLSLGRVKTIKTKVTNLRTTTTDIESEAEALRADINAALSLIEDTLRQEKKAPTSTEPGTFESKPVSDAMAV